MTSTYTLTKDVTISSFIVSASDTTSKAIDDFSFSTDTLTKHLKSSAVVSVSSSPASSNGFYPSTIASSLQQNTISTAKMYSVTSSVASYDTSSNTQIERTTDFPSTSLMTSTYTLKKYTTVVSGTVDEVTKDFYFNTVTLTKHLMSTAMAGISSSPATSNGFYPSTVTPSLQQNRSTKMYSASAKIKPTKSSLQRFASSHADEYKGNLKNDIKPLRCYLNGFSRIIYTNVLLITYCNNNSIYLYQSKRIICT